MTKPFSNDIPTREADTTRARCVWCLGDSPNIRCSCGLLYCSNECQQAAVKLGQHAYGCQAAETNLDLMQIGVLDHTIQLRHMPWEPGCSRVAMYQYRHNILKELFSAGLGRYSTCIIACAEHVLVSAAFAIRDRDARQLATEEATKRCLSLIHNSSLCFERKKPKTSKKLVKKHGSSVLVFVCGVIRGLHKGEHVLHVDSVLMSRTPDAGVEVEVNVDNEEIGLAYAADSLLDVDITMIKKVHDFMLDTRLVAHRVLLTENGISPDENVNVKIRDLKGSFADRRNIFETRRVI